MSGHIHISSAVVSVLPGRQENVARALSSMAGVEVFHQAPSKIVIVLEGPEIGAIGSRLAEITTLDGVLSANMVFEHATSLAELGE
ncbi:MAG: chaperone NapD [Pseudolabrys sp.]|jgi:nitrate reductase NapD